MSEEIKLPDLGDNISSGTIVSIFVSEGDTIVAEQGLLELETDKAVIEVPSPGAGKIIKILVKSGDEIHVGQTILELEADGTLSSNVVKEKEPETITVAPPEIPVAEMVKKTAPAALISSTAGPVDFKIPNMGDNAESGSVTSLLVKIGDKISVDQGLVELETDKAVIEVPSDINGTVKEILIKEGDTVKVGQTIMVVDAVESAVVKTEPPKPIRPESPAAEEKSEPLKKETEDVQTATVPPVKSAETSTGKIVAASPTVRRFAREIGVDIHEVNGSGPGGRISIEDVKTHSKKLHLQGSGISTSASADAPPLPNFSKFGAIETEPLNKLRQTSARNLSYAWSSIPHVTQMDKADISDLEKLRKANGKKAEAVGGKLTMTAILVKVIEAALRKFPDFNASIDIANNQIIYKKYFNIGIAVDTERGLLVPVIKDVEKKNIIQISVELSDIAKKARDKKLSIDDMQGGNFSISNLGGIGGTGFTPIVNSPDVAILGVSRAEMQPVFINGTFEPRLMMPLALSYDHRIIDGAAAARFLRWVCEVLEQPFNILLEG